MACRRTGWEEYKPGKWLFTVMDDTHSEVGTFDFTSNRMGGIFAMGLTTAIAKQSNILTTSCVRTAPDNTMNIWWQLVPYLIITVAEILFSITGYEFSYSQAPLSLKAIIQSLWLLMIAFGDLIDIGLVNLVNVFEQQEDFYFLLAGLMMALMLVFIFLAYRYTYVYYIHDGAEEEDTSKDEKKK